MRISLGIAAATAAGLVPLAAAAAALPEPVRAMIAKAAESEDPAVLAAVTAVAKETNPDSTAEIDALRASLAAAKSPPPPPEPEPVVWAGSVELGGSVAQGKHDTLGVYGVLDLSREGPRWTHRITARGDYQDTDGRRTTERASLAYEPRRRLSSERYAFGLAQYEHDRFLGYANRFTLGAGLGMKLADQPALKVAVDFGPAVRFTNFYDRADETALAARGNVKIRWLPTERITVSEEATVYAESDQASAKSITSLETVLFGPLKGKLSYNLHYERNGPMRRSALDSTARVSLLYAF